MVMKAAHHPLTSGGSRPGTATKGFGSRPGTPGNYVGTMSHRPKAIKNEEPSIEVAGSIVYKLKGWSRILESRESKIYSLFGNFWQVRVLPNGDLSQRSDWVAVLLVNKSDRPIHASYSITLKNQLEGADITWTDPDGKLLFGAKDSGDDYWGCDELILQCELEDESNGFLVDDTVELVVHITARNQDVLGAITPITAPAGDNGDGSSLEAASEELHELSTIMRQKVRLLSEDAILQDKLIKVRLGREADGGSGGHRSSTEKN